MIVERFNQTLRQKIAEFVTWNKNSHGSTRFLDKLDEYVYRPNHIIANHPSKHSGTILSVSYLLHGHGYDLETDFSSSATLLSFSYLLSGHGFALEIGFSSTATIVSVSFLLRGHGFDLETGF
jgi:hypothetical protein